MDNIKAEQNSLDTVENIYEITILLDFYGQLLTDRQFDMMDLHYNSDLSLGEIADIFNISRQGVHDGINKAKKALLGFEDKLGIVQFFREQKKNIENALEKIEHLGNTSPKLKEDPDYKQAMYLLSDVLDKY